MSSASSQPPPRRRTPIIDILQPVPPQAPRTPEQTLAERSEIASKKLAERFDALNQALTLAEKKLKELKPPHSVWVYYKAVCEDESRGGPSSYDVLGISKRDNQWRLVHGHDHDANDGGPFDVQALSECPVEIRVEATNELARLHTRIIEVKEQFIPQVEAAVETALAYCNGGVK